MSSVTVELISRTLREGFLLALFVCAPPLLASMVAGVLVGVLQSATQIQDHAIAFVPKLAAMAAVLLVSGPFVGTHVVRFAQALLALVPMVR
jgi:flagellar biosynthetic protein FliQ